MSPQRILECLAVAVLLAGMLFLAHGWACIGPFPNQLLMGGDLAVLAPPVADFRREIERIRLPVIPPFRYLPPAEEGLAAEVSVPVSVPVPAIRGHSPAGGQFGEGPGATESEGSTTQYVGSDYIPLKQYLSRQTIEVDRLDLQAALKEMNLPEKQRETSLARYQALRELLRSYTLADFLSSLAERGYHATLRQSGLELTVPPPPLPEMLKAPEGLPGEFADYLRGAIAYWRGRVDEARAAWQVVLDRPDRERRYHSTWAAFMLGKSFLPGDPAQAVGWFERVRELARQGFIDSLGLAASSLGWQARAELDRQRYPQVIELYLAQSATGDPTAWMSLILAARRVFAARPEALRQVATHPTAQRVITAYLIARGGPTPSLPTAPSTPLVKVWLDAVEANRVTEMEGAERLAWAAYQAGEMETARRWLDRAPPDEAMALWLRAKLLLHDGRIDQAASLLARVARLFPPEERWRDLPRWNSYWEELTPSKGEREEYWQDNPYWWGEISPSHQALGELGVLQLARRAYLEALDALLRAGFWLDAAYVAERVLTPEELIAYVDRHWPQAMPPQRIPGAERERSTAPSPGEPEEGGASEVAPWDLLSNGWSAPENLAIKIRYLLARRLARLGRWKEARNHYPPALRPDFDRYVRAMRVGQDRRLPARRRAAALWEAANIARRQSMELLGTEVEPDWRGFSGGFSLEAASFVRGFPEDAPLRMKIVQASPDERARLRHHLQPQKRFHYRYTAAALAWEAARLMPAQSEATAEVLCIAGLMAQKPRPASRGSVL